MVHLKVRPVTDRADDLRRLVELDSIRGAAALWVYAYHVWQFAGSPEWVVSCFGAQFNALIPVHDGPSGVDLFMVLSGFCLFWPLASNGDKPWDWREYAARRVGRILPAYYAAIAYAVLLPVGLVFFARQIGWQANLQPIPSLWQVLTHLTLTHTLFRETWDGITGAFWSMGLEAQFYAVFPLLVLAWRRFHVKAILGAGLLSLLFRVGAAIYMKDSDPLNGFLVSITFLGRWMQFAAGMAAALWVSGALRKKKPVGRVLWGGMALSSGILLVGALADRFASSSVLPWRDLQLACGYGLLLCAVCSAPSWLKIPFTRGPLPSLGRISYSFFLIHQPTAWYLMELFRKKWGVSGLPQLALGYTVGTVITLVISSAFYRVFEKPFLGSRWPLKKPQARVLTAQKSYQEVS